MCVCVCVCVPLSRHLINSLELSWCVPWSIPGLQYHPSHALQRLRHGSRSFSLCLSLYPAACSTTWFHKKEAGIIISCIISQLTGNSSKSALTPPLFLFFSSLLCLSAHYFTSLSLSAPILSLSFAVPTYYWWVDFTSQWCREGTVEYAVCECE